MKDNGDHAAFYFLLFVCIGSFIFFFMQWRRHTGYVVVLENGIQQYLPNGASYFLAWGDIVNIVNNQIIGQLELIPRDQSIQRPVMVDCKLSNFAELKGLIYNKTKANDKDLQLTVFHRSNLLRISFIIFATIFTAGGVALLFRGRVLPSTIFFLFSAGALYVRRFEIVSVSFHDEHLSLNYPRHSRYIHFYKIKDVRIISPQGIDIVVIEVDDKGQLKLGGFREGSLAFYRKLKATLPHLSQRHDLNQNAREGR